MLTNEVNLAKLRLIHKGLCTAEMVIRSQNEGSTLVALQVAIDIATDLIQTELKAKKAKKKGGKK